MGPTSAGGRRLLFCTVFTRNALAPTRALAEGLRRHAPGCRLYALLVDRPDGDFDPGSEPFTVVRYDDLGLPDPRGRLFRYGPGDLCCSLKPHVMAHALAAGPGDRVVYLDTDILVLAPFDGLDRLLDRHPVVLTPHVTGTAPGPVPEAVYLQAGTFNGGFAAVNRTPAGLAFLDWWKAALAEQCYVDWKEGLQADQKWLNQAPGYTDGLLTLRDPGYNVAYWNLHERGLARRSGRYAVRGGGPCVFFHFSGFDYDNPGRGSRFLPPGGPPPDPTAARLCHEYRDRLAAHGHAASRHWRYSYAAFDNGVRIPDLARGLYRKYARDGLWAGDPFATAGRDSFFAWLTRPAGGGLSPLYAGMLAEREDLRAAFPAAADLPRFRAWVASAGRADFGLDPALLDPAPDPGSPPGGPAARAFGVNVLGRVGAGEPATLAMRALAAGGVPAAAGPDGPYPINLVCLPPDVGRAAPGVRGGRRNVAYWDGDWADGPGAWDGAFAPFEEVWVPSRRAAEAVAARSRVPVRVVPFPATPPRRPGLTRADFGLPAGPFAFLAVPDAGGPAVARAFRAAFGRRDDVLLVLAAGRADPVAYARLLAGCVGAANVRVLDRPEFPDLVACCDAYVSLHRRAAPARALVGAMAAGKPAVVTVASGDSELVTADNGFLVRRGGAGADPDVDHAAELMARLAGDRALARAVGERGRADILRDFSAARIGAIMRGHLEALTPPRQAAG